MVLGTKTLAHVRYRCARALELAKEEIDMGWRAKVRSPSFCVPLWPFILLPAAVMAVLAPVQTQGEFGRGNVS
jgi:hypothetical protein